MFVRCLNLPPDICDDPKQHLYTKCSYVYPSGTQCTNPVPQYLNPLLCGGHCDNVNPPLDESGDSETTHEGTSTSSGAIETSGRSDITEGKPGLVETSSRTDISKSSGSLGTTDRSDTARDMSRGSLQGSGRGDDTRHYLLEPVEDVSFGETDKRDLPQLQDGELLED